MVRSPQPPLSRRSGGRRVDPRPPGSHRDARPFAGSGRSFLRHRARRPHEHQCPEEIDAYVGAAQVVDWAVQERRSYEWVLAEAESQGHAKALAALRAIGPPERGVYPGGTQAVQMQRRWLGALGGVSGDPRFLTKWMLSVLLAGDYPIGTKIRFTKGMARSMELIWPELGERIHFSSDVNEISVPVHFFAGSCDRITDVDQIANWCENLTAPAKRLEVVEGVGHLNLFEAPGRFVEFMLGVRATVAV